MKVFPTEKTVRVLSFLIAFNLFWAALTGCGVPDIPSTETLDEPDAAPLQPATITTSNTEDRSPSPSCPNPQSSFIHNFEVLPPPDLEEPAPRIPYIDPIFNTCLVRVTDRQADLTPDDPSRGLKNEYSRVQSFNADGSNILVRSIDGEWYLYDTATLQPLGRLPLATEPRWDAQDPELIFFDDGTRLLSHHLGSGKTTVLRDFTKDFPGLSLVAVWTRHEGRPSMDGRYWGLMAEDEDWLPIAFLVYDRIKDNVTIRDLRGVPGIEDDIDHVTISPLGTYFLASFDRSCEHGQTGDDNFPCGLMVYDHDLTGGRSLLRIIGHYDTALDADGNEVIIYADIDTDYISMLDLENGAITQLWPIDYSHNPLGFHFSGLAYGKPGWALVSTYSGGYPQAYTWMDDQVFAVELKSNGRVVRLAHTHSYVDQDMEHDYWAEPQASVNQNFTRILFTSNWGRSGSEEVEMFMIGLPPDWEDYLP